MVISWDFPWSMINLRLSCGLVWYDEGRPRYNYLAENGIPPWDSDLPQTILVLSLLKSTTNRTTWHPLLTWKVHFNKTTQRPNGPRYPGEPSTSRHLNWSPFLPPKFQWFLSTGISFEKWQFWTTYKSHFNTCFFFKKTWGFSQGHVSQTDFRSCWNRSCKREPAWMDISCRGIFVWARAMKRSFQLGHGGFGWCSWRLVWVYPLLI